MAASLMGITPMTEEHPRYHKDMLITATRPLAIRKKPSRFERLNIPQEEVPPSFRVTDRIRAILFALAEHRFLSTDLITRLDGGSPAYVRHLMRLLHRHGLVERPVGQAAYLSTFYHEGNVSLVYAITRKGMKLLAQLGAPVDARLNWTTKNTGSTALFLAHQLQVSQLACDFRLAMPTDKSLAFYDHNEMLAGFPEATQLHDFPYRLAVTAIVHDRKPPITLTVVPDRICAIKFKSVGKHLNFCIEVDRGTESLSTRSKKITAKATWRKKITGYYHAWKQNKFRETWNFESTRVLTITTSEVRIDHMLACQDDVTGGQAPGLFLYTTRERIKQHGILGSVWRSSKQDSISLVPR
jgi:hypothetical protein